MKTGEEARTYDKETHDFFADMPRSAIELIVEEQIVSPLKAGEKTLSQINSDIRSTDIPYGAQDFFIAIAKQEYQKIYGKDEENPFLKGSKKVNEDGLIKRVMKMLPDVLPPPPNKEEIIAEVIKKIPPPKAGKDAVVNYEAIINAVLDSLPPPEKGDPGDNGSPDSPDEIAEKINTLNDVLDPKVVIGLKELFDLVEKLKKRRTGGGSGGGVSMFIDLNDTPIAYRAKAGYAVVVNSQENGLVFQAISSYSFADDETPTGPINSSNKNFILSHTPSPVSSLRLYMNGQLQTRGTDYTISTNAIVFVSAPPTGVVLEAYYRY